MSYSEDTAHNCFRLQQRLVGIQSYDNQYYCYHSHKPIDNNKQPIGQPFQSNTKAMVNSFVYEYRQLTCKHACSSSTLVIRVPGGVNALESPLNRQHPFPTSENPSAMSIVYIQNTYHTKSCNTKPTDKLLDKPQIYSMYTNCILSTQYTCYTATLLHCYTATLLHCYTHYT